MSLPTPILDSVDERQVLAIEGGAVDDLVCDLWFSPGEPGSEDRAAAGETEEGVRKVAEAAIRARLREMIPGFELVGRDHAVGTRSFDKGAWGALARRDDLVWDERWNGALGR